MPPDENVNTAIPRVSIAMLTYNHVKFIAQAIEGVLSQKCDFKYELVIGDDCSTDGTREVCRRYAEQYPDRIVLLLPDKNLGASKNFMQVYSACRGEFLAMCEGDDYWTDPKKLRKQVRALVDHPHWSGCFHTIRVHSEDPTIPAHIPPSFDNLREFTLKDMVANNVIGTCSVMYRRRFVSQLPPFFLSLAICDWPLHILFAQHGPIGYLDEEMAVYRRHAGSMWSSWKRVEQIDHGLKGLFAVEWHAEEASRPVIAAGRREYLHREFFDEIERLNRIEARYRALQLHHISAIGKWIKECLLGVDKKRS